jgi:hypothetical protein
MKGIARSVNFSELDVFRAINIEIVVVCVRTCPVWSLSQQ